MTTQRSSAIVAALVLLLPACDSATGEDALTSADDEGFDDAEGFDEDRTVQAHWKFGAEYAQLLRYFGFERLLDRVGISRYEAGYPVPKYQQTLLVHFDGYCFDGTADASTLAPATTWNTLYNVENGVAARFREMSHGRFLLSMASAAYACSYFESFFFVDDRVVIDEAISSLVDDGFDFSEYDDNGDGQVTPNELAIIVSTNRPGYASNRGGCVQAGAVSQCGNVALFTVGADVDLMSHEVAHLFGTADLYGNWAGSPMHRGATLMADNRGHLDAWHKLELGWLRPDVVDMAGYPTQTSFLRCADDDQAEVEGSALLYDSRRGYHEYFLVEARCNGGLDSTSDTGLAIWQTRLDANSDLVGDMRQYGYPVAGCTQNGSAWSCPAPSMCLMDSAATTNEVNDAPCLETRFVRQGDGDDGYVPLLWRDGNEAPTRVRIVAPRYENGNHVGYDIELRSSSPVWSHGFEVAGDGGWWFGGNANIDRGIGLSHRGANNAWIRNWQGWNSINTSIATTPGRACSVSAWIRSSSTLTGGSMAVRSWSAGLPIIDAVPLTGATSNPEHGNYELHRFDFVADGSSALFYVGLWGNGSDAWIQVDDVAVHCE